MLLWFDVGWGQNFHLYGCATMLAMFMETKNRSHLLPTSKFTSPTVGRVHVTDANTSLEKFKDKVATNVVDD